MTRLPEMLSLTRVPCRALEQMGEPYLERLIPSGLDGAAPACALWVSLPGTTYTLQLVAGSGCDKWTTPIFDFGPEPQQRTPVATAQSARTEPIAQSPPTV